MIQAFGEAANDSIPAVLKLLACCRGIDMPELAEAAQSRRSVLSRLEGTDSRDFTDQPATSPEIEARWQVCDGAAAATLPFAHLRWSVACTSMVVTTMHPEAFQLQDDLKRADDDLRAACSDQFRYGPCGACCRSSPLLRYWLIWDGMATGIINP